MYENMTPEAIKAAILADVNQSMGLSSMAGSFADGVAGPVCEEMSKCYMALDAVPSMLFVDESSGGYIDLVGKQYFNITRRAGTRAVCEMLFTGTPGLVVPENTAFLTPGGLSFRLAAQVTLGAQGTAAGRLEAAEVGSVYNVDAGSISRMYVNLSGLTSFVNDDATGGTDNESDAALLARIQERVRRPATSGNGYQYRQWALEVAGVGNAKVVELPTGPGTVGITLVSSAYEEASSDIVEAVAAHIQKERPVGAAVSVASATELEITVAAQVVLDQGTTAGNVQDSLTMSLTEYLHSLIDAKFSPIYYDAEDDTSYTLIYNRVLALLLNIPGVTNFTTLTINGGSGDVTLQAGQIPVLGAVSVT